MSVQSAPPAREKRVPVTFRLSPNRRAWLDTVADHHRVDLSVVVRAALAVAATHAEEFARKIEEMG